MIVDLGRSSKKTEPDGSVSIVIIAIQQQFPLY